jgi:hypothetical protein
LRDKAVECVIATTFIESVKFWPALAEVMAGSLFYEGKKL